MTGQKREEEGERKKENNSDSPFFPLGFILFLPMISGFMWCFELQNIVLIRLVKICTKGQI